MTKDMVGERLGFARCRMKELLALNGGDLGGADQAQRQQLVQEFFFHLVGATEVLAQLVAEARHLDMDRRTFRCRRCRVYCQQRMQWDQPSHHSIAALEGSRCRLNPYSDDGYIFRILNYRHQVTHRARNPFLFKVGGGSAAGLTRSAHLFLDPRDPDRGESVQWAQRDMQHMLGLVERRCNEILALL